MSNSNPINGNTKQSISIPELHRAICIVLEYLGMTKRSTLRQAARSSMSIRLISSLLFWFFAAG